MKYSSFLFILLSTVSNAYIIESDRIDEIINHLHFSPNTLVIFDIDNTIACPSAELSSDEWFCYLTNKRMAEGYDYITSVYYALPSVYYAQFNVLLELTEDVIPFLMKELIAHNISIMALTTRSLFVAERTLEQLEHILVGFLIPNVSQDDLVLSMEYPCFYTQSILFAGNNDKGKALIKFFEEMNYYPEHVVFIDDKMKYLLSVEKALEECNIPFVGIRYSRCDEKVHNFNPIKAEQQWKQLRKKSH